MKCMNNMGTNNMFYCCILNKPVDSYFIEQPMNYFLNFSPYWKASGHISYELVFIFRIAGDTSQIRQVNFSYKKELKRHYSGMQKYRFRKFGYVLFCRIGDDMFMQLNTGTSLAWSKHWDAGLVLPLTFLFDFFLLFTKHLFKLSFLSLRKHRYFPWILHGSAYCGRIKKFKYIFFLFANFTLLKGPVF